VCCNYFVEYLEHIKEQDHSLCVAKDIYYKEIDNFIDVLDDENEKKRLKIEEENHDPNNLYQNEPVRGANP
jgi:hypothetical protein